MTFLKLAVFLGVFFLAQVVAAVELPAGGRTLVPLPATPECADFTGFATQRKVDPQYIASDYGQLAPFNTDGMIVMKDGRVVYEWYDGLIDENTPHILWSASKDVTMALLARALQEGATFNGQKVTLQTPVKVFYPHPGLVKLGPEQAALYDKMTIGNLVEMSANFEWKEYYDEDLQHSNFMPMLYLDGRKNMAEFALNTRLSPEGPGGRWNYSGGNANILMGILRQIYQNEGDGFAKRLLFDPLGMKGVRIGRDDAGNFVGSSYVYMRLEDMAKFGQLYLQEGMWNGRRLLPEGWTHDAQEVSPAVLKTATELDVIKKLGTAGRRVFWLNKNIYREDGTITEPGTGRKILYPQEMPQAPGDMYFAAGHYGQLIIVIPSQHVVIVRTGYNIKYWDHIQPLVVKALSCVTPGYRPNPVTSLVPPSAGRKLSGLEQFVQTLKDVPGELSMLDYLKDSGLASSLVAKETCSFLFTMNTAAKLRVAEMAPTFMDRSALPSIAITLLSKDMQVVVDPDLHQVTASRYLIDGTAGTKNTKFLNRYVARFDPLSDGDCDVNPEPAVGNVVSQACLRAKRWKTEKNNRCEADFWPGCNRQTALLCEPVSE